MLHHQEIQGQQDLDIEIKRIQAVQKDHFKSGALQSLETRLDGLNRLNQAITRYESRILEALKTDLGKPEVEARIVDVASIQDEIKVVKKNLARMLKPVRTKTNLPLLPAKSFTVLQPLGQTLIIGPWNYPFQLTLLPLVGAIAAGNTAVIKPSEFVPASCAVIKELIEDVFPENWVAVVEGGVDVSQALLNTPWNHIFFTGSTHVGQIVALAAARTMSPTTLELGGKSPAFVTENADIHLAARRIAYGKFFNAGQTCVSPDYMMVHESHRSKFVQALKDQILKMFGDNPEQSPDLGRIVNERNLDRLIGLIDKKKCVHGGQFNRETCFLAPTILDDVSWDDAIMKEEVFGPIIPVMYYTDLKETIQGVDDRDLPLAAYIFSKDKDEHDLFLKNLRFGGGCINDTNVHAVNPNLPFGGVGLSGSGRYHGKYSIETFSHRKAIVDYPTLVDLPVRYPPYDSWKQKLLKLVFR